MLSIFVIIAIIVKVDSVLKLSLIIKENKQETSSVVGIISVCSVELSIKKVFYTTFINFSMKYLSMCKVYTDVGCIK